MFGHVETLEDRIEHLVRLREVQDRTGGFTAFIGWTFQAPNTALERKVPKMAGSTEYLRTLAVSRLMLDNFPHVQGSWVTQGPKIGQLSLSFGADDLGGTMMEENVVSAAGASFCMPIPTIERLIEDAGYEPRQRTTQYEILDRAEAVS
jgi:cyclic dehypoxanthinyl futalosine synthase